MIQGTYNDKAHVIDILTNAFDTNISVNFVVKQDKNRTKRIKRLMEYSFEMCFQFGEILLSDDKKACALVFYPDKKKTTIKTILLDLELVFLTIGFFRLLKVLNRNSKIKQHYPSENICYLWFLAVDNKKQGTGIGTALIKDLIAKSISMGRPIYLETSMVKNVGFYERLGFGVYDEMVVPHELFFIRRDVL